MSHPDPIVLDKAWVIALELAGGKKDRLRPQHDGSIIIVNSPGFDISTWSKPVRKRTRKPVA